MSPKALTKTNAYIIKTLANAKWRLHHLYHIHNIKTGQISPFEPNHCQNLIETALLNHHKLLILKSRQMGISTYILIKMLDRALFYPHQEILLIAHNNEDGQSLLTRLKNIHHHITTPFNKILPTITINNRNELKFSNKSNIKVVNSARSHSPNMIHISELAYAYNDQEILQSIIPFPHALIIIESTPNNESGTFYELCQKAQGENPEFHLIFLPWYLDEKNAI